MTDDVERLDNNNPIETVIRNVQFDDTVMVMSPEEDIDEPIPDVYKDTDPYENQSLTTVLSRPWPIRSVNWNETSTGEILRFSPGASLLALSFNRDKLRDFKYIRASIRVSIRLNTTPFHAGMLLVAYAPEMSIDNLPTTLSEASIYPSRIVSAGAQQTVDFVIPWVHSEDYVEIEQNNLYFGFVSIWALTPLLTGNGTAVTTKVQVYANFEDVHVAGMLEHGL